MVAGLQIDLWAAPLPPVISFPSGATVRAGKPIAIRFAAGGDTNVIAYRYGVGHAGTDLRVPAPAPGQPADVLYTTAVGESGTVNVFARAEDLTGGQSRVAVAAFEVTPGSGTVSLSGVTYDGISGEPLSGVTVRLEPGGATVTSGPGGAYLFPAVALGDYTVSAVVGDRCSLSSLSLLTIAGPTVQDMFLTPMGDGFGYTCRVEPTAVIPVDTVLPLTGDDAVTEVALPFPLPFYELSAGTVWVDTNGYVSFVDPVGSHPFTGDPIPWFAPPKGFVAAFWDDLVVDAAASLRTGVVGGRFLIEWRNVHRKGDPAQRLTVQLALAEDGDITVAYDGLDGVAEQGAFAQVGIESPDETLGFSYSYRESVLASGTGITFIRP